MTPKLTCKDVGCRCIEDPVKLAREISKLEAENNKLREENERLHRANDKQWYTRHIPSVSIYIGGGR